MRQTFLLAIFTLVMSTGCSISSKLKKLDEEEYDHYMALRVYLDRPDARGERSKDERKAFFKNKTREERDQWLKDKGLWDKFYQYDEGAMRFDSPDRPSRTIVTDEIGRTPSRMRHIIEYEEGRYRRLSPEETERLNGFPAGWTDIEGIKPSRRGFLMGNALVVGIVERLAGPLAKLIRDRSEQ